MDFLSGGTTLLLDDDTPVSPRSGSSPSKIRKIALIGNHLPRRCGIATYTTDIFEAMRKRFPDVHIDVWAMNDGVEYSYPNTVKGTIDESEIESYRKAACEITAARPDMVWLQHEFGIFGGRAGDYILTLIDRLTVPIAVALHTVLANPDRDQRRVTEALIARCETIIVMADEAKNILIAHYGADPEQVVVIPHGIPDRPFTGNMAMKVRLGIADRDLILTFGLLSPGKGIETVISAMPDIIARHPNALYMVLGATHPHYIESMGEAYRDSLMEHAQALGVTDHVKFINGFFETDQVLDYLTAADIYVTPYLNPAQVTSGTLAYAVGLGKPIVSTPYVHANELLGEGFGHLVDFGDSAGFAEAIMTVLEDDEGTMTLRKRTYALGRTMIWPRLAEASLARFEQVALRHTAPAIPFRSCAIPNSLPMDAIFRMTDDTGMFQHSIFGVADRSHGYCIDDNARALMLLNRNAAMTDKRLTHIYCSFIQDAWNPATSSFRNFMGFDRRWLEDAGSEDSSGRTLWSLGITAANSEDPEVRAWAKSLFEQTIEPLADLQSPRTKAFMALGVLAEPALAQNYASLASQWVQSLVDLWSAHHRHEWNWFEPVLAYDNARICEVLIRFGQMFDRPDCIELGCSTLEWLIDQQTTPDGHFRPIGHDSFGRFHAAPLPFDQQPLEAWATVDACDAAFAATGSGRWIRAGRNSYRWFLGKNVSAIAMGDVETGECFDGLMPTGANRNRGAESILAFHHATLTIQRHRISAC
jgi:glycosyltransferase involved in cell wall biosynthesis